jgi:hypothetical protein
MHMLLLYCILWTCCSGTPGGRPWPHITCLRYGGEVWACQSESYTSDFSWTKFRSVVGCQTVHQHLMCNDYLTFYMWHSSICSSDNYQWLLIHCVHIPQWMYTSQTSIGYLYITDVGHLFSGIYLSWYAWVIYPPLGLKPILKKNCGDYFSCLFERSCLQVIIRYGSFL